MLEFALLLLGNSNGMNIANIVSIIVFAMLSWFVIENLYLPERVRVVINESTMLIPNWLIIQMYLFFCVLTIILM